MSDEGATLCGSIDSATASGEKLPQPHHHRERRPTDMCRVVSASEERSADVFRVASPPPAPFLFSQVVDGTKYRALHLNFGLVRGMMRRKRGLDLVSC